MTNAVMVGTNGARKLRREAAAKIDVAAINAAIADLHLHVTGLRHGELLLGFTASKDELSKIDLKALPDALLQRLAKIRIVGVHSITVG